MLRMTEEQASQLGACKGSPRAKSQLEGLFLQQLRIANLPIPTTEYRFAAPRRWRFDFAWPDLKLAVEVEGGTFGRTVQCHNCHQPVKRRTKTGWTTVRLGGRHNSGKGFENDCGKYNRAALLGWTVLRYTGSMIRSRVAIGEVQEALQRVEVADAG